MEKLIEELKNTRIDDIKKVNELLQKIENLGGNEK